MRWSNTEASNSFLLMKRIKINIKELAKQQKQNKMHADEPVTSLARCLCYLSHVMKKPAFCICENKDADQLHGKRAPDQRLCFRSIERTIPLLSKF